LMHRKSLNLSRKKRKWVEIIFKGDFNYLIN
jgi:hypothetical protein